jgi:RHS repeat-associated protein
MHWRNPRRVRRRASGRTVAYNIRFAGQVFDGEAGLHQNYLRDYDPATGGYLESDPIRLAGGLNTYAYVNGNPSNLVDPAGLMGFGAGAGHAGTRPPPYAPPPAYIPPATKAKICALLKANSWNSNFAWQVADKIRLGPWGNGIGTWGNLENREVENWLSIIAWPNGPQSDPGNINFYEGTVKFYFRWIYHTTDYSPEAWGTALEALSHKHDTPDDLQKWCKNCGK